VLNKVVLDDMTEGGDALVGGIEAAAGRQASQTCMCR
jgi:hypothetical protein